MSEWVNTRQPAPKQEASDDDYADDWFNDTDDEASKKASPVKAAAKPVEQEQEQSKPPTPTPSLPPPAPPTSKVSEKDEASPAAKKKKVPRKSVLPEPASWSPRDEPEPRKDAGSTPSPPEKEAPAASAPSASDPVPEEAKPVRVGVPLSLQSPPPKQSESPPPEKPATTDGVSGSGKAAWLTDSDEDVAQEQVPPVAQVLAPRQPSPPSTQNPQDVASTDEQPAVTPSADNEQTPPAKQPSKRGTPVKSHSTSRAASRSSSRTPKAAGDAPAEEVPAAEVVEEVPKSWLNRISAPRAVGKKHADLDAERKAELEAEARRREKYVADLKKNGVSERIESLGAPRAVKVDPRAGRPPPEIEERQRVANLKFKEASKRRAQEFDKVLETEQRRLFTRFNEYAVANGMAPLADPGSGEDADVEAIAMVLATSHLTGLPSAPPHAAPITSPPRSDRHHDWDDGATTDGATTSRTAGSPDRHLTNHSHASPSSSSSPKKHEDGSVRIAGHVSAHPTSTERSTFRPSTWKHSLDADVVDEIDSAEASPDRSRAHQRQQAPQNGRRAQSQITRVGSDGHLLPIKAKAATPTPSTVAKPIGGRRSNASSTPVPGTTTSIAESKRTKCAGAGGLSVIDGAVADFLLGDGNVRRSKVPAMYKKRTAGSLPPAQRK